jgi:hypothetical protein
VSARWALVEATWSVVNQPGPLRAFYLRIRARRGHGKAIVAAARKLAVLFWCMLSRGQDYAHQQPSLTAKKLRRLELAAGAPDRKGKPSGVWVTHEKMRRAEKQLAAQAQASYERTVPDWQASGANKKPAAQIPATTTPNLARADGTALTGGDLRPPEDPPRPIHHPRSPQIPLKKHHRHLDFHRSSI